MFVLAIVIGAVIGYLVSTGMFELHAAQPKGFKKGDFSITLTNEFQTVKLDEAFAAYETQSVAVIAIREDAALVGDIALEEYAQVVLETNQRTDLEIHQEPKYLWISYTDVSDGEEFYYYVAMYKGKEAYWTVNFAVEAKKADHYRDDFAKWANSVDVGTPADVV